MMPPTDYIYRSIGGEGMLVSSTTRDWWWWPEKAAPPPVAVSADQFTITRVYDGELVDVDASKCLGPNGTATAWAWTGTSTGTGATYKPTRVGANGPAVTMYLPGGVGTITCVVTDTTGGTRTFTSPVATIARQYVDGRTEWLWSTPDGGTYTMPFTLKAPAALPMRVVWEQLSGPTVTLSQKTWDWAPTAAGQTLDMAPTYTIPTSITGTHQAIVWRVKATFTTRPDLPPVQSKGLHHGIIGTPEPVSTQKFTHDFPPGSWTRTLASAHPLAPSAAYTVAGQSVAARADVEADFRAQIGRSGQINMNVWAFNMSLFKVSNATPRKTIQWDNARRFDYVPPDLYGGKQFFVNVPIPDGFVPSPGNDAHALMHDPATDTSWELYGARYDEGGQIVAANGGRTENVYSTTGHNVGFSVAACGLNQLTTHLTIDECERALAAYDKANPGRWDSIVGHVLSLQIWTPRRWDSFSWPAIQSDGSDNGAARPWMGQRFSIDPSLNLATLPLGPLGHVVARAMQKHGAIITDTASAVTVGAQSGVPTRFKTGVDPWTTMLAGKASWQALQPIPATAWRAHKIITSATEWASVVGGTIPTTPTTPTTTLPFTDRENVTFTGAGQTSKIHTYASGRAANAGLVLWLHGDAAYEFNNPSSTYIMGGTAGIRRVCADRGFVLVSALAPDTTGTVTWWENGMTKADYVKALLDAMTAGYGTRPGRVCLAGFSGGAQQTTQFFMRAYPEYFANGGLTCVIGGGEAPDTTPTYSTNVKTKLGMHWAAGANDTAANASDGFDGRGAATAGEAWFRGKGFTKTSIQIVPGEPHDISPNFGPVLAAQLDKHLPG